MAKNKVDKIDLINNNVEFSGESDLKTHNGGLGVLIAALFIVGETAGTGILAMPEAVAGLGWTGAFVIIICCLVAAITGINLGKCWLIVEERYPEYQNVKVRSPYPIIGFKAMGKFGRILSQVSLSSANYSGEPFAWSSFARK